MKKQMFVRFIVIGLLALVVVACASPAPAAIPTLSTPAMTTPLASLTPIGRQTANGIVCPATVKATYEGQFTIFEKNLDIPFEKGGIFSNQWPWKFDDAIKQVEQEALSLAEDRLMETMRLTAYDPPYPFLDEPQWGSTNYNLTNRSTEGRLFELTLDKLPNMPSEVAPACTAEWTLQFTIRPRQIAGYDYKRGQQWHISLSHLDSTGTTYMKVNSNGGNIEIPMRDEEMKAILMGQFDPKKAVSEIVMIDPLANVDAAEYEKDMIEYAARIKTEGTLVGQFDWTSIQGQEVVGDILARALLLKAWASGKKTHQVLWSAYLREKIVTSTSVNITSQPTSSTLVLGTGTIHGGGSNSSFNQTSISEPTINGLLFVLSK